MVNKTEVLDDIDNALTELNYVKVEVEDLKANEDGEIDKSLIIKYIDDVKDAINTLKNSFEDYDDEVSDIGDDLESLMRRLSEVVR